ncbi:MAG: SufE family protein [Bdellovibrionota bacterium]
MDQANKNNDWKKLSLAEREKALLEDLNTFADWKERYSYIIDMGTDLAPLADEFKRDEFKVKGCVSQVWLVAKKENETLIFSADSDSLFVKGLAGLLVKLFSGKSPTEIAEHPTNILMESGLIQNLSPNRTNGAASMFAKFKELAKIFT